MGPDPAGAGTAHTILTEPTVIRDFHAPYDLTEGSSRRMECLRGKEYPNDRRGSVQRVDVGTNLDTLFRMDASTAQEHGQSGCYVSLGTDLLRNFTAAKLTNPCGAISDSLNSPRSDGKGPDDLSLLCCG